MTSDIVHQRISKILQLYLYGVFRKLWRKAAVCSHFGSDASTIQKTCVSPRLIRGIQCTQIHWLGPVSYPPWGKICSTHSNHITWVYPRIEYPKIPWFLIIFPFLIAKILGPRMFLDKPTPTLSSRGFLSIHALGVWRIEPFWWVMLLGMSPSAPVTGIEL